MEVSINDVEGQKYFCLYLSIFRSKARRFVVNATHDLVHDLSLAFLFQRPPFSPLLLKVKETNDGLYTDTASQGQ